MIKFEISAFELGLYVGGSIMLILFAFTVGIILHDKFVQEIKPEDEEKYFPPKKQ